MGERIDRRRVRTRAAVLEAAEKLFVERGYRQTSIESIAAEADVAVSSIYFNFEGGKVDLYLALAAKAAESNAEYLEAAYDDSLDPFEQLAAVAESYARFHRENPLALRLLSLHDVEDRSDPRIQAGANAIRGSLDEMLGRQQELVGRALAAGGNEGVSAKSVTLFLFAAWNGAISMHARGQIGPRELDSVLAAGRSLAIGAIRSGDAAAL